MCLQEAAALTDAEAEVNPAGESEEFDNPVAEDDQEPGSSTAADGEAGGDGDLELADRVQGGDDDDTPTEEGDAPAEPLTLEVGELDEDDADLPSPSSGGGASPTEMQRFAQEFEPDFVESTMNSMIELLVEQSVDCRVLVAFQQMIARQPLTSDTMHIFYTLAARQDIPNEVMDAIIWMWCGGACADEATLQRMCAPGDRMESPRSGTSDTKGQLIVEVQKATDLLNKDGAFGKSDAYCCVRVEGHQRNTQVIKKNLNPVWDESFGYRVADRLSAVIEVYIFDDNKNNADALGRVTFPLHIVTPGTPLEMDFIIEPMRTMEEKHGELGELTLKMTFLPSDIQPEPSDLPTCHSIESVIAAARQKNMNKDLCDMLREAGAIVLTRATADLQEGHGAAQVQQTLVELEAEAMEEAKQGDRGLCKADLTYDAEADKAANAAKLRPMRQKYMTAISFAMSKFLGINPAVIGVIGGTLNKFTPAPEVTGIFSAAVLGTLGLPGKALPGIKNFLRDRLTEEMEKLVRASKLDSDNFKQLQKVCRGLGCAQSAVDRASELVAEADSFSTAGALFRLKGGQGAAEQGEINALDELVAGCDDDFVKAGIQNLQLMIWPALEETFDKVRELIDGNPAAELVSTQALCCGCL